MLENFKCKQWKRAKKNKKNAKANAKKPKMNPALPFNKWSKVFNMGEAFPPQIYEPNIQGNYVRERKREQFLNKENSSLMTYYFINMYQSFVRHKNFLGISNVVSWVSCCMLVVFLSQCPGRSCFTFCLSVSFFIHHIWLSYQKKGEQKTQDLLFSFINLEMFLRVGPTGFCSKLYKTG